MTRDRVERYQSICAELNRLNSCVTDIVSGSSDEFPYTEHPITIRGVASSPAIDHRRILLERDKAEIEAFGRLLTERQRKVFELKVLEGKAWKEVAVESGLNLTISGVKMLYQRIFANKRLDKTKV